MLNRNLSLLENKEKVLNLNTEEYRLDIGETKFEAIYSRSWSSGMTDQLSTLRMHADDR